MFPSKPTRSALYALTALLLTTTAFAQDTQPAISLPSVPPVSVSYSPPSHKNILLTTCLLYTLGDQDLLIRVAIGLQHSAHGRTKFRMRQR